MSRIKLPPTPPLPFNHTDAQKRVYDSATERMFEAFHQMVKLGIEADEAICKLGTPSQHHPNPDYEGTGVQMGTVTVMMGIRDNAYNSAQSIQVGQFHDFRDYFPFMWLRARINGRPHRPDAAPTWIDKVHAKHGIIRTFDADRLYREIREEEQEALDQSRRGL